MHTPQQIWRQVTPKIQVLIALALATILAFSAGLAAGIYGGATYLPALTTDRNAVPAAAQLPRAAPAVPQRPAVAPVAGAGSAYDGGHYGSPVMAPQTSPNVPAIGTGSVYDGGHYGAAPQTSPNVPISGAGSAYDGKHFGGVTAPAVALDAAQQGAMDYVRAHDAVEGQQAPATVNPNVPAIGTGSAYDGGHPGSPVSAPQTSPNVPISGTGSAYNGQ
jgi:hypothetical protein